MTPPTEDRPTDVDAASRQPAPTPPTAASETPRTSPPSGGDKPSFDVDAPSPEVEPIYLRSMPQKAAPVSPGSAAVPPTRGPPDSPPASDPPDPPPEAAPAPAAMKPVASDPGVLADAICRALADTLYLLSTREVVKAAIRSAQRSAEKASANGGLVRPAGSAKADAPPPSTEEPAAGPPPRPRGETRAPLGRTPPFGNSTARAWARQLAPRGRDGPSAP